jgi:colanic acid biosynthesis glycosyl transferase WcaI
MSSFLFINQYYWPDEAATAQLLTDLAEDLVSYGHEVTILCGRSRYASEANIEAGTFDQNGVRIERVGGSDLGRHQIHYRITDILSFLWAAKRRMRELPYHDLVVAMSSPPLVGMLGAEFHRRHRVPFVLWTQDIYPDVAEKLGALKNKFIRRYVRGKTRKIYERATRFILPGENMQKTLTDRGIPAEKISVIHNWADLDQIKSERVLDNSFRKKYGWGKDLVVMYSGHLGAAHDMETMSVFFALLQQEIPGIRFVLVGNTPRHKELAKRAEQMRISRFICLPSQPRSELGNLLGAADAHIVSQKQEADGLLVPSKFYGIIAAGRPVLYIGPKNSEIARYVTSGQLGVVIQNGQAAASVRQSVQTVKMTQDDPIFVSRIREWAERHVSRKKSSCRFHDVLMEVLNSYGN